MNILVEEQLMSYKVTKDDKTGEIEVSVKVHKWSEDVDGNLYADGTVNTWNLGTDEDVAKGKVATIVDSYQKGLEFVQSQVRTIFEEVEQTS